MQSIPPLTERRHTGEFIESEFPGKISRDSVTVRLAGAAVLEPGAVLGILSASGKYVEYDGAASDGSEEAAGILYARLDNWSDLPADVVGVVLNWGAEVKRDALVWATGTTSEEKAAAYASLRLRGIKERA